MRATDKLAAISTDLSPVGLITEGGGGYWCTPKNAFTFAHTGGDGIHFCMIPDGSDPMLENSPVYIVNPSDPCHFISVVAENFYDFISLVIEAENAEILANICLPITREQFLESLREGDDYMRQSPWVNYEEHRSSIGKAIAALSEAFHGDIKKIDDVYAHVKQIQAKTDFTKIEYTEEYYKSLGLIDNGETHGHTTVMFWYDE